MKAETAKILNPLPCIVLFAVLRVSQRAASVPADFRDVPPRAFREAMFRVIVLRTAAHDHGVPKAQAAVQPGFGRAELVPGPHLAIGKDPDQPPSQSGIPG